MGDAEFGLRAYRNGIISISNPEAYRMHLKSNIGGLRQLGSWDAFRPTKFFKPRPIPSVLYYARKYFGNYNALVFILINLPLSLSKYSKKSDYIYAFLSFLLFLLFSPIILFQTLIPGMYHQIFYLMGTKYQMKNKILIISSEFPPGQVE